MTVASDENVCYLAVKSMLFLSQLLYVSTINLYYGQTSFSIAVA